MAAESTAVYVYGIVPADVESQPHATGVGDPPGEVAVVRHAEIAALIPARVRAATGHAR
ncbi:hypothetical protein [Nocardia sp. CA-120079]|uniref:hypothetical protein n=1 Tax=Nocardia sp. CA-120079 TaxID=3239974 RepID=UPI003D997CCC